MLKVTTLNGSIQLHEQKKLVYTKGAYVGYLYITCVNEREVCDVKLNRDQVEELIDSLRKSLLW